MRNTCRLASHLDVLTAPEQHFRSFTFSTMQKSDRASLCEHVCAERIRAIFLPSGQAGVMDGGQYRARGSQGVQSALIGGGAE